MLENPTVEMMKQYFYSFSFFHNLKNKKSGSVLKTGFSLFYTGSNSSADKKTTPSIRTEELPKLSKKSGGSLKMYKHVKENCQQIGFY
ncbi:hypothetical protein DOZ91_24725 [Peribacillus frigoritolerans]|nr:hypothetical protein DOZ91_24725 [Peribacillus frigoritolerans]